LRAGDPAQPPARGFFEADFLKLTPWRSKNRQPFHAVWNGGKRECRSMQVHMDRKWLEWLDGNGNAIAFILISLLIVIAFAY
jgi:hypothetical protein